MAVVITHPEMGIYLGCCLGLGFWSRLDAAGQDCAVTFTDEGKARTHVATWDENGNPDDYHYIDVVPSSPDGYATVADLRDAGLASLLGELGCCELKTMSTVGRT